MNKLDALFSDDKLALIFYLTGGEFPLEETLKIVEILVESGADCLELGVPFSDPLADGATIQEAMQIALKRDTSLRDILELAKEISKRFQMPLLLMGYYNPFYQYGLSRLCQEAKERGVDGLIVPDLPPEEAEELIESVRENDLRTVFLLAPTSDEKRYKIVGGVTTGFIYYVSVKGITGEREELPKDIEEKVPRIKEVTGKPVAVGFGISKTSHIRWLRDFADGAVVGSALLGLLRKYEGETRFKVVRDFVSSLSKETIKTIGLKGFVE